MRQRRKHPVSALVLACLFLASSLCVPSSAAEPTDWPALKSAFLRDIRGDHAKRIRAIQSLQAGDCGEAVDILLDLYDQVKRGVDPVADIAIRRPAETELQNILDVLAGYSSESAAAALSTSGLESRKPLKREAALATVLASGLPGTRPTLESMLTGGKLSLTETWLVIDCLGRIADAASIPTLRTALPSDKDWRGRLATVETLGKIASPRGCALLIDCMDKSPRKVQTAARAELRKLTGCSFDTVDQWRKWLEANAAAIEEGSFTAKSAPAAAGQESLSFYGLDMDSSRVIFVMDISGSMKDEVVGIKKYEGKTRLEALKAEVGELLKNMDPETWFTIIVYCHDIHLWKDRMQPASRTAVASAIDFVNRLNSFGGTNVHDALKAAFDIAMREQTYGPDSLFLLSDGNPTAGELDDPDDILRDMRKRNADLRLCINTVFVGDDEGDVFMRRLAEENRGLYVSFKPAKKPEENESD